MQIVWRPAAITDLEAARHYIMRDNPAAADRVRAAIVAAIEQLLDSPNLGKPGRVEGTRERVIPQTPYIAAYVVTGDQVIILSLLHSARLWPEVF